MADEKEKQPKDETAPKPKARRSTAAKKAASAKEEKPKRTRTTARKADGETKAKTPTRRRAPAKPKPEKPEAAPEPKEQPKEQPKAQPKEQPKEQLKAAEEPKAPARRRRAAPKPEAPRAPVSAPVVTARAKYVRSSARKARLVIDHVRGKPIAEAQALLRHSPRGVARDLERLLKSALANAENNHDLVGDDLYVKEIYADEGPTLKRYRPRAQGRAYRIRKRTSHLTVALTPKE